MTPSTLHVPPIIARAVLPDEELMAAYLSDDPAEFWRLHEARFGKDEEEPE